MASHERVQLLGGRDVGPDGAKRYARRFGVTPEWLLRGLRPTQGASRYPISGPSSSRNRRRSSCR